MDVFTPSPEGGLTGDQSTKQKRRNGPLRTSEVIGSVPDSLDPVSQVSPRDGHIG